MKIFKKIFLLIIIIIFTSFTTSNKHEIVNEIMKVSSFFKEHKQFRIKMNFSVYKGYKNSSAESSTIGFFERNDTLSKQILDNVITFSRKKIQITVNRKDRVVVLNNGITDPYKISSIDKLIKLVDMTDNVTLTKNKESNLRQIEFYFSNPMREYNKIKIKYYKESYMIQKIVFYKNSAAGMGKEWQDIKARGEIVFTKLNTTNHLNFSDFNLSSYAKLYKGHLIGIKKYTGFRIIDLRTNK